MVKLCARNSKCQTLPNLNQQNPSLNRYNVTSTRLGRDQPLTAVKRHTDGNLPLHGRLGKLSRERIFKENNFCIIKLKQSISSLWKTMQEFS